MSIVIEVSNSPELRTKLKKSVEEAVFTIAILKKIGKANISTLTDRIFCQKIIYFANRLGVSPAYDFSLYVRGPYSSDLTNDLYLLKPYFDKVLPAEIVSGDLKSRFDKFEIELSKKSSRLLELAATIDFCHLIFKSKEKALSKTKELKSASEEELAISKDFLKNIGLW